MDSFTDCTTTANPDGETGQEWCFVEAPMLDQGTKGWGACRPVIDYDYIREVAAQSLRAKLSDAERVRMNKAHGSISRR